MLSPKGTWPHQLEPPGQKVISHYSSLIMETAENLNTTIHSPVSKTGKKTYKSFKKSIFLKKVLGNDICHCSKVAPVLWPCLCLGVHLPEALGIVPL